MIVYCDGASNPHSKRSGIGIVWFERDQLKDPNDGKTLLYHQTPQHIVSREIKGSDTKYTYPTNNEAEYRALIVALEESMSMGLDEIIIYMDSNLVVNQVCDKWKINFPHLQKLKNQVDDYRNKIKFEVKHVRREYNTHADKASKDCIKKT